MMTWLLARTIPWRLIGIGLAALAIVALVSSGYAYLDKLNRMIADLQVALASEQTARQAAEDTIQLIQRSLSQSQARIDDLQKANLKSQDEWIASLKLIDDLNDCPPAPPVPAITPETQNTKSSNDAVDRLNRANADINRMLERIGN